MTTTTISKNNCNNYRYCYYILFVTSAAAKTFQLTTCITQVQRKMVLYAQMSHRVIDILLHTLFALLWMRRQRAKSNSIVRLNRIGEIAIS